MSTLRKALLAATVLGLIGPLHLSAAQAQNLNPQLTPGQPTPAANAQYFDGRFLRADDLKSDKHTVGQQSKAQVRRSQQLKENQSPSSAPVIEGSPLCGKYC